MGNAYTATAKAAPKTAARAFPRQPIVPLGEGHDEDAILILPVPDHVSSNGVAILCQCVNETNAHFQFAKNLAHHRGNNTLHQQTNEDVPDILRHLGTFGWFMWDGCCSFRMMSQRGQLMVLGCGVGSNQRKYERAGHLAVMLNYFLQKIVDNPNTEIPNEGQLARLCEALLDTFVSVRNREISGRSFMMNELDHVLATVFRAPQPPPRLELLDRDGNPAHWHDDQWYWNGHQWSQGGW